MSSTGAIACDGPRSHLFYVGADGKAAFESFEAAVEVKARAGANSGLYFHTAFQEKDWPAQGFEVQVNNSQKQHGDYLELKMTGSLYGIRNVYKALAKDDEWFTLHVTVREAARPDPRERHAGGRLDRAAGPAPGGSAEDEPPRTRHVRPAVPRPGEQGLLSGTCG